MPITMSSRHIFALVALLIISLVPAKAQTTDSVDVLDYDLTLDLSAGVPFAGEAVLTVQLTRSIDHFALQLVGTVDSMLINGTSVAAPRIDSIPSAGIAPMTPFTLTVFYHGRNYVEGYGWGGFHFDRDMIYNLGVAFDEDPHSIGRAMFPCRDNFTDKATYTLRVKSKAGWTAECGGIVQSREVDSLGCEHSVWRIEQPTPTYLVSVSVAGYHRINTTVAGYPVTLGYTTQDSANVAATFAQLDSVVPKFERCFGPYRWGRIGYIPTQKGSMEHVNNIALSRDFMDNPNSAHGMITIPHELAHAWFGNIVTCRTEADMWFNEGGASFCSEVSREATHGREAAQKFYQENLETVIRTAHVNDGGYYPLSPMPHSLTYGTTTYDKGALVWHSLRGYLGDSVFYAAVQRLMADKAFDNVDAYEVRDSLASYTGVDLTGFFDFHVFSLGFLDYNIELVGDTLTIRQQGVATDNIARSSRVPVAFMSADGSIVKRWYTLSGTDTVIAITDLPFSPVRCLLDPDCEISDAATRCEMHLTETGAQTNNAAHFRVNVTELTDPIDIYVDHHWGKPYGLDTVAGVLRTPGRYWTVSGNFDYSNRISGQFHYCRTNHLDQGFYESAGTLDSIVLMHRYNSHHPWGCVSHSHNSSANGYFSCLLEQGEYALAVVDRALVGIEEPSTTSDISLFPNPLRKGEALTINTPVEGSFTVTIHDTAGRRVWRKKGCRNGQSLHPALKAGTYLVTIENNCVSLQSKLVQL